MKDIAIIIPVHRLDNEQEVKMLSNAIHNAKECQKYYDEKLNIYIVTPNKNVLEGLITEDCHIIINDGETDFCSQINCAAVNIKEDYFSILEYDDEYNEKWFSMAKKYFYTNEDVSLFLPINVQIISADNSRQFGNEAAWAMEFSESLGFVDFNCLTDYYGFNITGGIFNRNDFIAIGGLKPSIEVAFNYELLRRMTNKKLKVFVVPKEGYKHIIDRENSLTDICKKTLVQEDIDKWYIRAQEEYQNIPDNIKG